MVKPEEDDMEENVKKKLKITSRHKVQSNETITKEEVKAERCEVCKQDFDRLIVYNGHPNRSVEEYVALTDERLLLFNGDEADMNDEDIRPLNRITCFDVYDRKGHLCAFDGGLIETNKYLYFSGYIKPIYSEDSSPENGIPAYDMGPINAWYITGFDGGEKGIVTFSTQYGEYYLMEPSLDYQPLMKGVNEKIALTKIVIEFLLDESWQSPTYEDLLQQLSVSGEQNINEETLLRHAQFICDQVVSFDSTIDTGEEKALITAPCMRTLVRMAGVTFNTGNSVRKMEKGIKKKEKTVQWTKATTTNLVRDCFESFFTDQLAKSGNEPKGPKKKRCGACESCQQPDCGSCTHCKDMLKFGGSGRSKQACKLRRCPNMDIQEADESDNDEEDEDDETQKEEDKLPCSKRIIHQVTWIGEPVSTIKARKYYIQADADGMTISVGDFVMLQPQTTDRLFLIAKVCYMWEEDLGGPMFHAMLFIRGSDTVLGETTDPREIFLQTHCENCPVGCIISKAQVEQRFISNNWAENGGTDTLPPQLEDDGKTFFFSKQYDPKFARFEDIPEVVTNSSSAHTPCISCREKVEVLNFETPTIDDRGCILWHNDIYKVGSGVYLKPEVFNLVTETSLFPTPDLDTNVDVNVYPEYFRKSFDTSKTSNGDTPQPYGIGIIRDISKRGGRIKITVGIMYRPENTNKGTFSTYQMDLNLLYYSEEEKTVPFDEVMGKCYISFVDNLTVSPSEWFNEGPDRFYFMETFNRKKMSFEEVSTTGAKVGQPGKGKGKGKGKSKVEHSVSDIPPNWVNVSEPLTCMDVFAGCGGLSEGLHQSGVANTKWAIEKEAAAAQAFKLNNPDTKVFTDDCNELLHKIMTGHGTEIGLPDKGDVQLLVGGPPCQGFSGMNRFNAGQYSLFKNSLIASYLSYCDYYRPHYFILENVRNFVSFKKSLVLKLTLRCLLAMGYQATFGVVQAGHYGVPQTRRRLIIFAAAPGYKLPNYPEPLHVFNKRGCQLSVKVGNQRYTNGLRRISSAPFRTITVRDALSELPDIKNGSSKRELMYDSDPMSHFQRMVRAGATTDIIKDHICKEMSPLVATRIANIPTSVGSDWRDLPNIVLQLSDGTHSNKLRYAYRTKKQGTKNPPRGVCRCSTGKGGCDPTDRQFNTLIPWCLPHTADRHNNWSGLYGRLEWEGFFSTTITNPEPMGKQGRVLHPDQDRVVSVRECARSQGFPDRYQFAGNILSKHKQIGNAVPPPLGAALGREIMKALK